MATAGVLNLNKPAGTTSSAVVRRLKAVSGARRVGHAGTLDPLATGVLPILLESATRLADYALLLPKTYVAEIRLGFRTATDDAEGVPVQVADAGALDAETLLGALATFVGETMQQPPLYSAVKQQGQRSYRRARRGDGVVPVARPVRVYSLELLRFEPGHPAVAQVRVVCGSGTYLRSIARDLGDRLGVGGYLGALQRTEYGPLRIEDGVAVDELRDAADVERHLLPPEAILPAMTSVRLTLEQVAHVRQGRPVRVLPEPELGPLRAHDELGRLVALGRTDPLRRTFVPEKVF